MHRLTAFGLLGLFASGCSARVQGPAKLECRAAPMFAVVGEPVTVTCTVRSFPPNAKLVLTQELVGDDTPVPEQIVMAGDPQRVYVWRFIMTQRFYKLITGTARLGHDPWEWGQREVLSPGDPTHIRGIDDDEGTTVWQVRIRVYAGADRWSETRIHGVLSCYACEE